MKRETAKIVHQFFDQEALKAYIEDRTQELYQALGFAENIEKVRLHQGALRELELLLKAKQYAKNVLEVK